MEQKVDLDALEAALGKATPGKWTVEMDGQSDDDSPCDVIIPEINRILHSTEWADPEDFERDVANAEAIALAHNALPALIAELRELRAESAAIKARAWQSIETAPKNGTGFLAWNESLRIVEASWWSDNMAGITHWQPFPDGPTHALPLPPAPEAQ